MNNQDIYILEETILSSPISYTWLPPYHFNFETLCSNSLYLSETSRSIQSKAMVFLLFLQKQLNHRCVTNVFLLKTRHSIIPDTVKAINSVTAETRTHTHMYSLPSRCSTAAFVARLQLVSLAENTCNPAMLLELTTGTVLVLTPYFSQ